MRELFGARGGEIVLRMQRAVISHNLNNARTLKVMPLRIEQSELRHFQFIYSKLDDMYILY